MFRIIVLMITVQFLTSCSQEKVPEINVKKQVENQSGTYTFGFGHDMPITSAQHVAAERFAKIVEEKTQGKVVVNIYPNQEMGTDQEMIEMARKGDLGIILPPTAKLSTLAPKMLFLDIPFLFETKKILYEFLDENLGRDMLDSLKPLGLLGVTFWESGNKQFTANKAIQNPEDFKNLNARTMRSPLLVDQFRMMGANPIPIDFHRIYSAMKDKVVDAGENSLASIESLRLYEQQSHLILSDHAYLGQVFCFSRKALDGLPGEFQEILVATAQEITSFQRSKVLENEKKHIEVMQRFGTKVSSLNSEQKEEFSIALRPLLEKYRSKIGTGFIEKAMQFISERKPINENLIYVGLDADLTHQGAPSGLAIKRGMELAIEELNQKGGVLGKKLAIISRDHSGISARGIENMKYFSGIKSLVAVVGGLHSPVALSELDIIHEKKLIYLDPWAAATHIVDNKFSPNYVFRVSVRDENAGGFFVKQALGRNFKKIALLLENTGWGRSNETAILNALQKKSLMPSAIEWFNWEEKNFLPQLNRIVDSDADVIIMVANSNEGLKIIETMEKQSILLPIISHWGITGGEFGKTFGGKGSKIDLQVLQTFSFINSKTKRTKDIIEKYKRKYQVESRREIVAPVGTAHAYDLVHLLAKAIKKAGTLERPEIRKALETLGSYPGLIKDYARPFSPENHDALDSEDFFLARYDSDGAIIPVLEE